MNERIDALVKKATIRVNNPILNTDGKIVVDDWQEGISISKFAELIVQECAQVYWSIDSGELHDEYVAALKKHFGVE
jgi:hypothetical protein